jgi:hypothetical protein
MENLNQMIKEETDTAPKFNETPNDPTDYQSEEVVEEVTEEVVEEVENTDLPLTTLGSWFQQYHGSLDNVFMIASQARNVRPGRYLIVSALDPNGNFLENEEIERTLHLYDNAAIQPVIDLPPANMRLYNNNTFRVVYELSDELVVKMYGIKTGIIALFSFAIDGGILPYIKVTAKKGAESLAIPEGNIEAYREALQRPVDIETFQLLYKQSTKSDTTFTTNSDAINWLLARQDNITDINHHLEIDKVIMTLLS